MNKNFSLNISKIQIKKAIVCSLFIFVCSLLFKSIRLFIPSTIEIRMENVFPPIIGLYFVTIGSIACAFGNFLDNIFNDCNNLNFNIYAINLFFDFLYAYILYKLWYSFNIKDEYKTPKINNTNGILRYSYSIFLESITVTLLLKLSISLIKNSNISLKFILLEFFNNYNFEELITATKIQSSLLPSIFPEFPKRNDFEVFANMSPAKWVSGDFYDFYLFGNNLTFVIADVSGKGIPAALFMMTAKSVIKNSFLSSNDIREVVRKVNNELCENNKTLMFVTAFLGIIDLKMGIMRYVNAGHMPPLLKHDSEVFKYINVKNNCILGIIPNADFEKQEINLNKGDVIFAYTDGVTEAMDSWGNLYGMNRLKDVLNKENMKSRDIYEIIPMIIKDIDDFCKGEKQNDDITMLTFKY